MSDKIKLLHKATTALWLELPESVARDFTDIQQVAIEELQARVEALEDKLERINQWCRAYPRTVFIEPTKEQWAEANKVLEAHRPSTPGLTAISGSNMRHVVEGIQALAATEQEDKT